MHQSLGRYHLKCLPQAKFNFDLSTQMICGKVLYNIKCLLRFCESARENKKLALTQIPAQLRLEIILNNIYILAQLFLRMFQKELFTHSWICNLAISANRLSKHPQIYSKWKQVFFFYFSDKPHFSFLIKKQALLR